MSSKFNDRNDRNDRNSPEGGYTKEDWQRIRSTPVELCTIEELVREVASRSKVIFCTLIPKNSEENKIETCYSGNLFTIVGLLKSHAFRDLQATIDREYRIRCDRECREETDDPDDPDFDG